MLRGKRCSLRNRLRNLSMNDIECADIVEPSSIVFTCINVELNCNLFTGLYVKLLNTVFAKDVKYHLSWVLSRYFNYILLSHPWITCT